MASSLTAGKSRFLASPVKQVTKSNFASSLHQFKSDLQSAEFISISLLKTGSFSLPWLRILPFDSPETTYLKSKLSAESFQPLLFSACPFSHASASPYNFHLFPQHNTFSCHTPSLSSMARAAFDFNACFHDGLSYSSRVQESDAKRRKFGSWMHPSSLADSIFKERVKSRLAHWRKACQDGSFAQSLRRVLLGGEGEDYGSRPGIGIDVCSERQGQLVFESAEEVSDELVAVLVGGDNAVVRVLLTSSEEDKRILLTELQIAEDEESLKIRGFRQVIDLISGSHKTVVSANWLHDLAFVHAKFVGPLPATLPEFMCSLRLLFSNVVDLNHLLREFGGGLGRAKNVSSCLKRRCFVPMEVEVVEQGEEGGKKRFHGSNVLRLGFLFAELNVLLKNGSPALEHAGSIEDYANAFNPALLTLGESGDDDDDETSWCIDAARRVRTDNMLFLWGFGGANSAVELKRRLLRIHPVLSEEFDVHLVDKTCAVVVFGRSGSAETLLEDMSSVDAVSGVLREMVVEGLRAAGYDAYLRVCRLGLWEGDLADSLEIALAETVEDLSRTNTNEMNWNNEMMVDLNDL